MKPYAAALLGCLPIIFSHLAGAREAALHYNFSTGETNVYAVEIAVNTEASSETNTGNVILVTEAATTNGTVLSCRGNLRQTVRRMNPPGMGFFSQPYYSPMGQTLPRDCKIELDEYGMEIRNGGDFPLAVPLGKLVQSLFEPLPAKTGTSEKTDTTTVLDEPLWLGPAEAFGQTGMNGMPYGGRFMGYPQAAPATLAVSRHIQFSQESLTANQVKLHRKTSLESLVRSEKGPRLTASSSSDLSFDRTIGRLIRIETTGQIVAESENGTHHATVSFTARLLTGAEFAAVFAPPPPPAPPRVLTGAELDKLVEDLKSNEPETRRQAVRNVNGAEVTAPSGELIDLMANMTGDTDAYVRMTAGAFLTQHATTNQLPALLRIVNSSDWSARRNAIHTLGKLHDPRSIQPLVDFIARGSSMGSDEQDLSAAMGGFGPAAEKPVRELLQDRNINTQRSACNLLKEIGTAESLPALEKLVGDSDANLSQAAVEAIQAIKQRQ